MTALRNEAEADSELDDLPDTDPAEGQWSKDQMLMATVIDELRALRHLYILAHTEKSSRPKAPEPVPRPGYKRRPRSRLTPEQRKMLDPRLRGQSGGGPG